MSSKPIEPMLTGLSCRSVEVVLNGRCVLNDVSLEIEQGEWLGLIGPNGAGKSTLLRCLAGVIAHAGAVELDDGRTPTAADLALVPQTPLLPVGMTVAEYVLLGRTAHLGWLARESRADREIASSVISRLDLERFANRRVDSLSGGEAQRVVIARALAQQAPILLLDEPTSALDVGHQASVLELVDELRSADGLTVVAAMHDLTTAARFADRLVLLSEGTVVAEGGPADVLTAQQLSEVYATSLSVNRVHGEIVVLAAPRTNRSGVQQEPIHVREIQ